MSKPLALGVVFQLVCFMKTKTVVGEFTSTAGCLKRMLKVEFGGKRNRVHSRPLANTCGVCLPVYDETAKPTKISITIVG